MVTLIKNPSGRIVSMTPERKAYLLDPKPMHTDPQNGKKIALIKQEYEQGWTEPTEADIAAWEEENKPKPTGTVAPAVAPAADETAKPKKKTKKEIAEAEAAAAAKDAELEASVRDAEDDKEKFDALSVAGQEMYLDIFGEAPEAPAA